MSGKWIQRKQTEHSCKKPSSINEVRLATEGDIWECGECGSQWLVTKVRTGFDPRPGEGEYGWIEWRIYKLRFSGAYKD